MAQTETDQKEYKGRAVVTYGRSLMAVVIAQSLSRRGIEVISCDSLGMTASAFSKYVEDSFIHVDEGSVSEADFINDMCAHIERFKPSDDRPYVLIPTFRDSKIFARNRERFEGLIEVAAPNCDAIDRISPKDHLFETLKDVDIAQPACFHPQSAQDVERALADLSMPALIKPVEGVGGRGIEFFDDRDEMRSRALDRVGSEDPPPLLQETVPGHDYCLGFYCQDGEIVAHAAYHNLETMGGEGRAGAMRETVDSAPFLDPAQKLLSAIGWSGYGEIDFMWTGQTSDPAIIIEVNPRFWAGLFQTVESGVDFPWIAFHQAAYGDLPDIGEPVIGTKTRIPGLWMSGALHNILGQSGDTDKAKSSWKSFLDHAAAGHMNSGLASLKDMIAELPDLRDTIDYILERNKSASDAKSELQLLDDPLVTFGAFFVFSSLIRDGKLPPELIHE